MSRASASAYRFTPWFVVRWAGSAITGRRRELWRDGRELLRRRPPIVRGREHLPGDGRYVLLMNHYEREGLRVWWPAIAVSASLGRPDLRWVITNRFYRYRLFGLPLPARVVGGALRLVARMYGCVSIERRQEGAMARAMALRTIQRTLHGPRPISIGTTPEAEYGGGPALREPYPSSGKAMAWLSRGTVPLVPVGIGEEQGRIVIRIGEPFVLEWPGAAEARRQHEALAARLMRALAGVLPEEQRGRWPPPSDPER